MANVKAKKRASSKLKSPSGHKNRQVGSRNTGSRLRGEELKKAVKRLQNDPDEAEARKQWKQIEWSIFGVRYKD